MSIDKVIDTLCNESYVLDYHQLNRVQEVAFEMEVECINWRWNNT